MARKRVGEERRAQIVEALYRCLKVKPFHETSIKNIAAEAGVNHGVLHYYFSNKEEILLTYIDYIIEQYKSQYNDWIAAKKDSIRSDQIFIQELFSFVVDRITLNKNLSKVFIEIWQIANYDKTVRMKLQKAYREWIKTVTDEVTKITGDAELSGNLSRGLIAFFEGIALFSVIMPAKDFHTDEILKWMAERIFFVIEK